MRDHSALRHELRRDSGEPSRDIFEREAMKSVAPDAALFITSRNGEAAGGRRNAVVESGIEAGDLRQVGPDRRDSADRSQAARLV
jgi:hypothetical protein